MSESADTEWTPFELPGDCVAYVRMDHVDGRVVITDIVFHGPDVGVAAMRALKLNRVRATAQQARVTQAAPREPVRRTLRQGHGVDDEFYRSIAAAYREYAMNGRGIVAAIVAEMGGDVAPTNVHRWISEARRRGFLGRGTRGRTS